MKSSSSRTLATAAVSLGIFLQMAASCRADTVEMFDFRLGDHIIDYPVSEMDVVASELYGPRGDAYIKVNVQNGNHVSMTFVAPQVEIGYLEHDWVNRTEPAQTALKIPSVDEFSFGETRASELQAAFDEDGYHFVCRQTVPVSGGVLSFISFDHPNDADVVYSFVVEYSQELAELGLVDPEAIDLEQAVLVAAIAARRSYLEEIWCDRTQAYSAQAIVPELPEINSFTDFLPGGEQIADPSIWQVETEPFLLISKNGAITWGDRILITPNSNECNSVDMIIWSHSADRAALNSLKGQDVPGSFNLLVAGGQKVPLQTPVTLAVVIEPQIGSGEQLPFLVGSFHIGGFDLERLAIAEEDKSVFGFSLEFPRGTAGLKSNYWSLEGLHEAAVEMLRLCQEAI